MSAGLRTTFRLVKGAPLTVLFAMLHLGGQAGLLEICKLTTYTDKTVDKALHILMDAGLVRRTHFHNGFMLTKGGMQLPMALTEKFMAMRADVGNIPMLNDLGEIPTSENLLSTATAESLNINGQVYSQNLEAVEAGRKNSEVDQELLDLYRSWGIGGNVRLELASARRLTVDQAKAIHQDWLPRQATVGLLIHKLREDKPRPTDEERNRKYVEGEFSEFVEH